MLVLVAIASSLDFIGGVVLSQVVVYIWWALGVVTF